MSNPEKETSPGNPLIVQIDEKLRGLPSNQSTCSIFKVPSRLRHVNERAFEPEILSIGPYHRGKDKLKMMEEHKKRYLQELLQRRGESSVERYVEAMSGVEGKARKFYDQSVSLCQDEFVEMLLLDGCFIVELIRKCNNIPGVSGEDDPVFEVPWILSCIETDTMLLENQLPFFVLLKLFTMTSGQSEKDFFGMALQFCQQIFQGLGNRRIPETECKHLLDMLYHAGYQPPDSTESPKEIDWYFIRNAKELQEAGIKFERRKGSSRLLFDVDFSENGTIEIPRLKIDDRTESLFRNLDAYEQCSPGKHLYVTDYITLMDCLISTQEDVQILRHSEIIENELGDDGKVCSLFNNLCRNVTNSQRRHFCYNEVFNRVNEHCNRKRNVWMATLKHDYFNSPWALLSFLAAVVLLLFTLAQTVFTVMSYFQMD
ncbi:hypothetical protein NC652_009584 [Populus alba x Populus x berolinensis]|nr:hypothetical protein NC652_009584 [Populus alba x Populus x berolinensis]